MRPLFEFKQGDYNLRYESGGICAVLSAYWIKMMRDGEDDRKNKLIRAIDTFGPVLQRTYRKGWDSIEDVKANCSGVLRLGGGCIIADSKQWGSMPSGDTLINYIKDKRKTGFHFNIGFSIGTDAAAHAVAFWRSGEQGLLPSGHVYFFDPNVGEFKGNKGEVSSWLSLFIQQHYGSINWSYILHCVKAAEPKILKGQGKKVM
jgi:hypothetical protein